MIRSGLFALLATAALTVGCAGGIRTIPGTQVPDTDQNRAILQVVERYRLALEAKDTPALLSMAARDYWEDGGTPTGADDYGYPGLKDVLAGRFLRAESIRYSVRYMGVRRQSNRAWVDLLIDASYTINTARGPMRLDKRDQNQVVLVQVDGKWKFQSGM